VQSEDREVLPFVEKRYVADGRVGGLSWPLGEGALVHGAVA
jgi:hypothetical protein